MIKTIEAKSDQLNSDDLMGGSITIKITNVSGMDSKEQPIALSYEGDNNKPFKPCKTVRRILVNVWGADGSKYIGRSMILYRDEKVKFGGIEVGGIRVSHMSHIDKPITMALTATRANKKPFTVHPLKSENNETLRDNLEKEALKGSAALVAAWNSLTPSQKQSALPYKDELKTRAIEFDNQQQKEGE